MRVLVGIGGIGVEVCGVEIWDWGVGEDVK